MHLDPESSGGVCARVGKFYAELPAAVVETLSTGPETQKQKAFALDPDDIP